MTATARGSYLGLEQGPLFTGAATSSDVPDLYPVAIDGHPYLIDWASKQFSHDSIPYLQPYFLTEGDVNERTLSPKAGWRRSVTSWHHGAGQQHFDNDTSDRAQFYSSKGIDPWSQWQLKLLPDVTSLRSSANTNLLLTTAGTYLYVADGAALKWRNVGDGSWSDAGIGSTVGAVCSDGYTVYARLSSGVATTTKGAASATTGWSALVPDVLAFVNGRLMASVGPSVFNITTYKLPAPSGLAVAPQGVAGSTTYGYRVSALNSAGETLACTEVTTATGNASLSSSNFNKLTWTAVAGATSYNVYGRTSGAELKLNTTPVTTATFNDTGTLTPSGALPATDTTNSAPAALWTHPNTDFVWVGFAEGKSCIYAAGYSGDRSQVYRIGISTDGTALVVPIACLPGLPLGEVVASVSTYLGFVVLGTSKGARLATPDSNGDLTLGARIDTTSPVRCAAGGDRFVWYGLENFDSTSTGLGRLDLTAETSAGVPAYASDLMATTTGQVSSVVTWNGLRVFTVNGSGVYEQSANLVPSGWARSGLVTFNIPDPKVALYGSVRRTQPQAGSFTVEIQADGGSWIPMGTQSDSGQTVVLNAHETHGDEFEVRITLTRSGGDTTAGPNLHRVTLIALPAAQSGQIITVPLMIAENETVADQQRVRDVDGEVAYLESLRDSKRVVKYQQFSRTYTVTVEDFKTLPIGPSEDGRALGNVTFIAQLKTLDPPPN